MANSSNTGRPAFESELAGIVEALQEERSAVALGARDMQLGMRLLVLEEARRLKAERDPDDARVTRYENSSRVMLRRAAALEVEAQIAGIRVPPVARTDTLLQGRVTDEAYGGVAQLTVTLVDEKGKPVAAVPPVKTGDSGYFAFVLNPAQTEAIGPGRTLTLQVGGSSGKLLVPAAAVPFTVTPGEMVAAELRLRTSELDALGLRPAFPAARAAARAAAKPPPGEAKAAQRDAGPKKNP